MPDTHPPLESLNTLGIKHVPHHPVRFDLVETTAASTGNDTGRILASMLEHGETLDAIPEKDMRFGWIREERRSTYISVAAALVCVARGS